MSDAYLRALERTALACPCEEHHQRWVEELRRTAPQDPPLAMQFLPSEHDSPRPWLEGDSRRIADCGGPFEDHIRRVIKENERVRREGWSRRWANCPRYGTTAIVGTSYQAIRAINALRVFRRRLPRANNGMRYEHLSHEARTA